MTQEELNNLKAKIKLTNKSVNFKIIHKESKQIYRIGSSYSPKTDRYVLKYLTSNWGIQASSEQLLEQYEVYNEL